MDIDRRGFIVAMVAAAFAPVAAGMVRKWGAAAASAAPLLRPASRSADARVCAHCGDAGHTALDPACPGNRERLATLQSAARREAATPRRPGAWT